MYLYSTNYSIPYSASVVHLSQVLYGIWHLKCYRFNLFRLYRWSDILFESDDGRITCIIYRLLCEIYILSFVIQWYSIPIIGATNRFIRATFHLSLVDIRGNILAQKFLQYTLRCNILCRILKSLRDIFLQYNCCIQVHSSRCEWL